MSHTRKKKNNLILFAIIAALVLLISSSFVVFAVGDNQGYRTISVVEVFGRVSVVKDGIEYSAYQGMMLQEGHQIVTSGNSYVRLVLDDDKYVKLESGSKLSFETLGALGSGKTRLKLERGAITVELVSALKEDEEFVVNTPNAVLAVRGTYFRIDLKTTPKGDLLANVMTYGGKVATQRILPSGEVVDEEVIVDAGYKTSINMDKTNTVYLVADIGTSEDNEYSNVIPIVMDDISDDDIVDIFFSAENGHELFLTTEEAKTSAEARNINLEEQTSVYIKAEQMKAEQEESVDAEETGVDTAAVVANDSQPLVRIEEVSEETQEVETTVTTVHPLIDGDLDAAPTVHTHTEVAGGVKDIHKICQECKEILGTEHVLIAKQTIEPTCARKGEMLYVCDCGYSYTEELQTKSHIPVDGGTAAAHSVCDTCNAVLSDEHSFTEVVTEEPTCTKKGVKTISCDCGYSYTTEVDAAGHTLVNAGEETCHSKCSVCGQTVSTSHVYSETVVHPATCTANGYAEYVCSCGYQYSGEILSTGHTPTSGNEETCHTKCGVCGITLEDGSAHSYTSEITKVATCEGKGETTYTCSCGYSYTEEIAATAHEKEREDLSATVCKGCQQAWVDLDTNIFPDGVFLDYVKQFDTDNSGYLLGKEMETVTEIDVSGDISFDGRITSLEGIETFQALTTLNCSYNSDLAYLDLSNNLNIVELNCCYNNMPQGINLTDCNDLKRLYIDYTTGITSFNQITMGSLVELEEFRMRYVNLDFAEAGIDLSWFDSLKTIWIDSASLSNSEWAVASAALPASLQVLHMSGNSATNNGTEYLSGTIDFSKFTAMRELYFYDNYDVTEVSLTNCNNLVSLNLAGTGMTELDVSGLDKLATLILYSNSSFCDGLLSLNTSGCTALNELRVSDIAALETLNISGSGVTSLDLESNVSLKTLNASNCSMLYSILMNREEASEYSLSSVDISGCNTLGELHIGSTALTSIDVTDAINMYTLDLQGCSGLTTLDLSQNTALTQLYVGNTNLTYLDMSNCGNISSISTNGRYFDGLLNISGLMNAAAVITD